MTREKAIEVLRDKKPKIQKFYGEAELFEAVDMAIKALEQESILDKIMAEIEKERDAFGKWDESDRWYAYDECLDIIDRYREGGPEE